MYQQSLILHTTSKMTNDELVAIHDLLKGHGFSIDIISVSEYTSKYGKEETKEEAYDTEAPLPIREAARTPGVPLPYGKKKRHKQGHKPKGN